MGDSERAEGQPMPVAIAVKRIEGAREQLGLFRERTPELKQASLPGASEGR